MQGHVHGVLRNSGFVVYVVNEFAHGVEVIYRFIAYTGKPVVDYSGITKELSK